MEEKKLRYIQFSMIPGLGVVSQNRLLRLCGGIDGCYELEGKELLRRCRNGEKELRVEERRARLFIENRYSRSIEDQASTVEEECRKKNITIVTHEESNYPERFRNLPDVPVILYTIGRLRINEFTRSVGIVGARRCSTEGKQVAISMSEKETANGSAIISGLAKGIDSYAHTAVVKQKGYTIAVLGNGPDICYPVEHKRLYSEIVSHGCILSEYPPETRPKSYMFPKRNRLIAALSDELLVIDAGCHSGTDTTVKDCLKYGRKVFRIGEPAAEEGSSAVLRGNRQRVVSCPEL